MRRKDEEEEEERDENRKMRNQTLFSLEMGIRGEGWTWKEDNASSYT